MNHQWWVTICIPERCELIITDTSSVNTYLNTYIGYVSLSYTVYERSYTVYDEPFGEKVYEIVILIFIEEIRLDMN